MSSLFSRIIAGEIPAEKVYEDAEIYAFLDIRPHNLGHTLVVPKKEISDILDIDDALYTYLMLAAKNIIGPAIKEATGCMRIGYVVEGFGVPDHAHIHLIPLFQGGDLHPEKAHSESPEAMHNIAERIRICISKYAK